MKKAAVVTGASSGIGLAISRMLVKNGYEVFGIARDFSKVHKELLPGKEALKTAEPFLHAFLYQIK